MAQKSPSARGRPRRYDPDTALARATAVFRAKGFAGTTLDELGAAMDMNRPSIHAAFGDKSALFMKALARYEAEGEAALTAALGADQPLRVALVELFTLMAQRFAAQDEGPGGCLLFSVASVETHVPTIRDVVADATCSLQQAFAARFASAVSSGELPATLVPADLAVLATGLVHSLSLRARSGEDEQTLARVIGIFVDAICGATS